jgi:G:T-mismatch repair DNA endonuclease (very short patch repair protein)
VRSKDGKIEISFRRDLWKESFRYRKNSTHYFGKPDLVLKKISNGYFYRFVLLARLQKTLQIADNE